MAIDRSKTDLIKAKYEELTGTMSDPVVAANHEEYMKYSKELGARPAVMMRCVNLQMPSFPRTKQR